MQIDWSKVDACAGGLTKAEYHTEALFFLGADYFYEDKKIPQPSAGVFMLLEMVDNAFITGKPIQDIDVDIAFFILSKKEKSVGAVLEIKQFETDWQDFLTPFIESFKKYNRTIIKTLLVNYFKFSTNGFDMLPKNEDENQEPKKMIFDTTWLTGYVSACHKITGYEMDYIIWDMPILKGGFCIAELGLENGSKGIERKQEWEAMIAEIKRQAEGE